MIKNIIHWYLYDDELWMKLGNREYEKHFNEVRTLMDKMYVEVFLQYQGFHDWKIESLIVDYRMTFPEITINIYRDELRKQLRFSQCLEFWKESHADRKPPFPPEIQIIAFEKETGSMNIRIGIGLTTGEIYYIICEASDVSITDA